MMRNDSSSSSIVVGVQRDHAADAEKREHEDNDAALRARVQEVLGEPDLVWRVERATGDPAAVLGRIADEAQASVIVLVTREPEAGRALTEFFGGSIAVQLTHRQQRPVLGVPVRPVGSDGELPGIRP
jgi:hypothetical protein